MERIKIHTQAQIAYHASMRGVSKPLPSGTAEKISKAKTGKPNLAKSRKGIVQERTQARLTYWESMRGEKQTQTPARIAANQAKKGKPQLPDHGVKVRQTRITKNGTGSDLSWRQSPAFHEFRRLVKLRDNCACQQCGITELDYKNQQRIQNRTKIEDLNIHHTFPADDFKEFRLDVSKAITLCKLCHRKADIALQQDKQTKSGIYAIKLPIRLVTYEESINNNNGPSQTSTS